MKITILSNLFPPYVIGGAEEIAAQLARNLHEMGHEIDVISSCRKSDLKGARYRVDLWKGIKVWRMAPWNLYWQYDRAKKNPNTLERAAWHLIDLYNVSVAKPLDEILEQTRPEVFNTHNLDGFSPIVWPVAYRHTAAIVHTLQDFHLLCPMASMQKPNGDFCEQLCTGCGFYSRYYLFFQKYVRTLVCPARHIAEMHRQSGWTNPNIVFVPNAVDIGEVAAPPIEKTSPLQVVFMARLEKEKGCDLLLSTIAHFENNPAIHFHVAGRGSYEKKFQELAGKSSHYTWHGFVEGEQKRKLLNCGDVFLQLSQWRETAPLSLIEAKSYGLYLIGTEIGGIPEIIGDQKLGFGQCLPRNQSEPLFTVLEEAIKDRANIRLNRQRRLKAPLYGTREMAEDYLKVYTLALRAK